MLLYPGGPNLRESMEYVQTHQVVEESEGEREKRYWNTYTTRCNDMRAESVRVHGTRRDYSSWAVDVDEFSADDIHTFSVRAGRANGQPYFCYESSNLRGRCCDATN